MGKFIWGTGNVMVKETILQKTGMLEGELTKRKLRSPRTRLLTVHDSQ